jgi:hypothetical protein
MAIATPPVRIRGIVTFIDQVVVRMTREPAKADLSALAAHCVEISRLERRPLRYVPMFPWRMVLNQVQPAAFSMLQQWADDSAFADKDGVLVLGLYINKIELALDLLTKTKDEAAHLGQYFRDRIVRSHARSLPRRSMNTYYTNRKRWSATNLAEYHDGLSKVAGCPCSHIEIRALGAKEVRRLGIGCPADVLKLDLREVWRRFLILDEVKWDTLANQFLGRPKSKRRELRTYKRLGVVIDVQKRFAVMAMRAYAPESLLVPPSERISQSNRWTALEVRIALAKQKSWFRPESCMNRLDDVSLLLPTSVTWANTAFLFCLNKHAGCDTILLRTQSSALIDGDSRSPKTTAYATGMLV